MNRITIIIFSILFYSSQMGFSSNYNNYCNHIKFDSDSTNIYDLFLQATIKGNTQTIDSLLKLGINADSATHNGITPLMYAAQEGNLKVIQLLLENGAIINAQPTNKITPILSSVYAGKTDAAKLLISNGANINLKDNSGMSPMLASIQKNDTILIDFLLDTDADLLAQNNNGQNVMHMAAISSNIEVAKKLLSLGLNINQKDKLGFTPLMLSVELNQRDFAFFLISNGADINLTNKQGFSALTLSIIYNDPYFVELFLINGAETTMHPVKAKDYWFFAKETRNKEIYKLLIRHDVGRNLKPIINQPFIGVTTFLNSGNFMAGISLGLHEAKYNFLWQFSCLINPFVRSTLYTKNEITYQFWERDIRIQSKLEKQFPIKQFRSNTIGLSLGTTPAYTFGNFRGTNFKPNSGFSIAPSCGIYWKAANFKIKTGYEHHFSISGNNKISGLYSSFLYIIN